MKSQLFLLFLASIPGWTQTPYEKECFQFVISLGDVHERKSDGSLVNSMNESRRKTQIQNREMVGRLKEEVQSQPETQSTPQPTSLSKPLLERSLGAIENNPRRLATESQRMTLPASLREAEKITALAKREPSPEKVPTSVSDNASLYEKGELPFVETGKFPLSDKLGTPKSVSGDGSRVLFQEGEKIRTISPQSKLWDIKETRVPGLDNAVLSNDGSRILAHARDSLSILDPAKGIIATTPSTPQRGTSLSLTPDGTRFATSGMGPDNRASIQIGKINPETGKLSVEKTFKLNSGKESQIRSIKLSEDGKKVTAATNETITEYDAVTGEKLRAAVNQPPTSSPISIPNIRETVLLGDRSLSSSLRGGPIQSWDFSSGKAQTISEPRMRGKTILSSSQDGKTLLAADLKTREAVILRERKPREERISRTAPEKTIKRPLAADAPQPNLTPGEIPFQEVKRFPFSQEGLPLAVSGDGTRVVTLTGNELKMTSPGEISSTVYIPKSGRLKSVALTADGNRMFVLTDKAIELVDSNGNQISELVTPNSPRKFPLAITPDGSRFAFTQILDNVRSRIHFGTVDPNTGRMTLQTVNTRLYENTQFTDVQLNSQGDVLTIVTPKKAIRINSQTGETLSEVALNSGSTLGHIVEDGKTLIAAIAPGQKARIDLITGERSPVDPRLANHDIMTVSSDGRTLLTRDSGHQNESVIWSTEGTPHRK